jgi:hypothetical protein
MAWLCRGEGADKAEDCRECYIFQSIGHDRRSPLVPRNVFSDVRFSSFERLLCCLKSIKIRAQRCLFGIPGSVRA